MHSVKNKVAVITGATSGIGRAAALCFAKHGVKVVAAGRNEKSGEFLEQEILDQGGEAIFVRTDVSDPDSIKALMKSVEKHFGGMDFAFNNAGIEGSLLAPLAELKEEDWDAVMNTNLKGVWLCMKYQIPILMKREGGAIVNTSTNLTRRGMAGTAAYTASKAGVEMLTRIAAMEYGKERIRVNAINPGAVDTPMLHRAVTDDVLDQIKKSNLLGDIANPENIGEVALWLCSEEARHITGQCLVIDGGHSI